MVTGFVGPSAEVLVPLLIRRSSDSEPTRLHVWVDTAFTGDLALSESLIRNLGLRKTVTTLAVLADGSSRRVDTFAGYVDWFDEQREVEVVAGQNEIPLLGACLLLGLRLEVDYSAMSVRIDLPA